MDGMWVEGVRRTRQSVWIARRGSFLGEVVGESWFGVTVVSGRCNRDFVDVYNAERWGGCGRLEMTLDGEADLLQQWTPKKLRECRLASKARNREGRYGRNGRERVEWMAPARRVNGGGGGDGGGGRRRQWSRRRGRALSISGRLALLDRQEEG